MEREQLLNEMKALATSGRLEVLKLSAIESIIGKHIQTIYFGYNGQDGVDDFTVGKVISEYELASMDTMQDGRTRAEYLESYMKPERLNLMKRTHVLLTDTGRDTYIRQHPEYNPTGEFTCSDVDRYVFYKVVEENK